MKKTLPTSHPSLWQWPLDLDAYDRTPVLTEREYQDLENRLMTPGARLDKRSWGSLSRFFQPLEDAMNLDASADEDHRCPRGERRETIRVMALEMYWRRTPFWAWTLETWLEIVGESNASFAQRYGWARQPHDVYARRCIPKLAYLLCPSLPVAPLLEQIHSTPLARKIFGRKILDATIARVHTQLASWGYQQTNTEYLGRGISYLLLSNRNPFLENLTLSVLREAHQQCSSRVVQDVLFCISRALTGMGIIEETVSGKRAELLHEVKAHDPPAGMSKEWLAWCDRWSKTTTLQDARRYYYLLRNIGRWLASSHPEVTSPAHWTDELAAEFVHTVMHWNVGQWSDPQYYQSRALANLGKPLRPQSKTALLEALRRFLSDCQQWGWIPLRLSVPQALRTPSSLSRLLGPAPRVIDQEFWAKLLWAAMNLEESDLPRASHHEIACYPFELHRAAAMVWCFAALRSDEVVRLRVGCIRWQYEDVMIPEIGGSLPKDAVCFLEVPVNKTSGAYTKAVHSLVGKRIQEWEQLRPHPQPHLLDHKTGELIQFLFEYRGKRLPRSYVNDSLIPILCRKAGLPLEDSRGRITSHRARATIASQLYNAAEPLSIFELKEYLGHKYLSSTQHYLQVDLTKLASKVAKSGYLEQNMATISVLLDQKAVMSGAAARGDPWKYYDLGHGFCMNPFWAECVHRMACARCPFYRPKDSLKGQLVEGKANLVHMLEFVSLTEDEKALVTEGVGLHQELIERLADVPTPAGPTPRELKAEHKQDTMVIPLQSVLRTRNQKGSEP